MMTTQKYEAALEALRQQIIDGKFTSLGYIPRRQVMQELGISHGTMNEVVRTLQNEGYISYTGKNNRLLPQLPRKKVPTLDKSFLNTMRDMGIHVVTRYVQPPTRLPMDAELARAFNVPEGTLYIARWRVDGSPTQPYRITKKVYLSDLVTDDLLAQMQANEEFDLILQLKEQGIVTTAWDEDIEARDATSEEQRLLNLPKSGTVLEVVRTFYDRRGGKVLWRNQIVHVGFLFVMHSEHEGERYWKT
jgi:DNA-binding GntR family transcriptional regulator